MRGIKKIGIALLIIFLCTGCFSYQDINKVIFATMVVIDVADSSNVMLHVEAFHSYRSKKGNTEIGERLVFQATGSTVFEAIRAIDRSAIYKIDYTQNKIILFTERATEHGLEEFLDIFMRDQEVLLYPATLVFQGDPSYLMKASFKQEDFTGTYLNYLLKNEVIGSRLKRNQINVLFNYRDIADQVALMDVIGLIEHEGEERIELRGHCILKDDKKIDILDIEKTKIFNVVNNEFKNGVFNVDHPTEKNKSITLQVLKSKAKTKYDFQEDGQVRVKKDVKMEVSMGETGSPIELTDEMRRKIEEELEKRIRNEGQQLFHEYADQNIDLFELNQGIYRRRPDLYKEGDLSKISLTINAMVNMTTSSETRGYR